MPAPPDDDSSACQCPACGEPVPAAGNPMQNVLQCPNCGEQFFRTGDEATPPAEAAGADDETRERTELQAQRDAELSELRIRQVANLRRGAIRGRSWLIIGAITCVVGTAQLVQMAIHDLRLGLRLGPATDVILAAIAIAIFRQLLRRIRDLSREIRASKLADPPTPPDFSSLSDGSQQYANLDRLSGPRDST